MAKQDYINVFAYSPELSLIHPTARGNLILFLINWIAAGCKPIDLNQCQNPIGMKDDVWNRYKAPATMVIKALMPELRKIYENRENAREGVREWRKRQKQTKASSHTFVDSENNLQAQEKRPATLSHKPSIGPNRHTKTPPDSPEEGMFTD